MALQVTGVAGQNPENRALEGSFGGGIFSL